ncbi:hypothetical protein S225a_16210 [Candidatus Brocadiaceae bacterium S225]|nr:hypothetical protein S225a_16210 [Candidatus Brocadiaceae bacterium S225]
MVWPVLVKVPPLNRKPPVPVACIVPLLVKARALSGSISMALAWSAIIVPSLIIPPPLSSNRPAPLIVWLTPCVIVEPSVRIRLALGAALFITTLPVPLRAIPPLNVRSVLLLVPLSSHVPLLVSPPVMIESVVLP